MTKPQAVIVIAVVLVLLGLSATVALAINAHHTYRNIIVPHVSIGGIDVSGLDSLAATAKIQKSFDTMMNKGLIVTVGDETHIIDLFGVSTETASGAPLLDFDSNTAVRAALTAGHSSNAFVDGFLILSDEFFGSLNFGSAVKVNTSALNTALFDAFQDKQVLATETDFAPLFSHGSLSSLAPVLGTEGRTLNLDADLVASRLVTDATDFVLSPITIATMPLPPSVTVSDAEALIPQATLDINAAPYIITGMNTSGEAQTWTVSQKTIADWIIPLHDIEKGFVIGLDAVKMVDFLNDLHTALDIQSQNARFSIDGSKVTEFQGSKDGNVVDDDAFFNLLESALGTSTALTPLTVPMHVETASITTENVNSLGIKEIIGEAMTTYATSPKNRKANIKHGAEKLNGLLIAPGETVSLISALRPFTLADGYLSELVIKGDEIKAEVAGGLCQIGTTAFRAVMHAGLEVAERRNHSLAISYYNDPSNGNPGTDATIYDPAPDFKFKNDMPTYLLLATKADSEKGEVTFTFWGTKDGRVGSYTPPTVLSRSGMGATVYKETDALAPGVKQCQHGYPGATATFDYTVLYTDGTSKVTPYLSSYRSLPEICLVGKAIADVPPAVADSSAVVTDGAVVAE